MARRIHVARLVAGEALELDRRQAHHARDVLRLAAGDAVDLFDDAGRAAAGTIERCDAGGVAIRVERVEEAKQGRGGGILIAAAVPKGERADWMVEKLSELGVARFIPLAAARSIVLPQGKSKRQRWERIATESAKQCRRVGVMRIDELKDLEEVLADPELGAAGFLSTEHSARPLAEYVRDGVCRWMDPSPPPSPLPSRRVRGEGEIQARAALTLLVGPEGGWTVQEIERMKAAGLTGLKLTGTILRVETAAVAAAAVATVCLQDGAGEGVRPGGAAESAGTGRNP